MIVTEVGDNFTDSDECWNLIIKFKIRICKLLDNNFLCSCKSTNKSENKAKKINISQIRENKCFKSSIV